MSEILEEIKKKLVFPLDFPSQEKAEFIQNALLAFGAFVSCLVGFYKQSLIWLLATYASAILLTLVVVLPAYPAYTARKVQWVRPKIVN